MSRRTGHNDVVNGREEESDGLLATPSPHVRQAGSRLAWLASPSFGAPDALAAPHHGTPPGPAPPRASLLAARQRTARNGGPPASDTHNALAHTHTATLPRHTILSYPPWAGHCGRLKQGSRPSTYLLRLF